MFFFFLNKKGGLGRRVGGGVKKVSSRDLKGNQCIKATKIEHNTNILLKCSAKVGAGGIYVYVFVMYCNHVKDKQHLFVNAFS